MGAENELQQWQPQQSLGERVLSLVNQQYPQEIRPLKLVQELGISLEAACAELCGLLQLSVQQGVCLSSNPESNTLTFKFPLDLNISPCPTLFVTMLTPELRKKFALLPEGYSGADNISRNNNASSDNGSAPASSQSNTTSHDKKEKTQVPVIAPYYKALVHAGLEKEDAAEQVEQATAELQRAQEKLKNEMKLPMYKYPMLQRLSRKRIIPGRVMIHNG